MSGLFRHSGEFSFWKKQVVQTLDVVTVSGEFQLRLRQLEKSLLQALNEVKGRILDDDTIITTLENLKREAAEVTRKVEETDIVMQEVETVSQQYLPLSTACSSIYFTMESLKQVTAGATPAGRRSLCASRLMAVARCFLSDPLPVPVLPPVFPGHLPQRLVREPEPQGHHRPHAAPLHHHEGPLPGREPGARLSPGREGGRSFSRDGSVSRPCPQVAFNRVARGMLHQDHITFAMLLARIKLKGTIG